MSDAVNFTMLPRWDEMDFSRNCTLFGNFLATFLMPNPWDPTETVGGSYMLSIQFFEASMPENYLYPNTTDGYKELFEVITLWYTRNIYDHYVYYEDHPEASYWENTQEFNEKVIWAPIKTCPAEYCKALGYTGNADLSGVGVYVSYYVEAGLATMYLIAYTIWQIQKWRKINNPVPQTPTAPELSEKSKIKEPRGIPLSRRINDSFRGSLGSFLTASMLMSVVLLGAAIYITGGKAKSVKARQDKGDESQQLPYLSSAIYDMVLSLLASVFSVFPVLLLYSLMGRHHGQSAKKGHEGSSTDIHRVWLRRGVLLVIWCLAATQVYLAPRGDMNYYERHDPNAEMYKDFCDHRGGASYWNGMKAAQFLVIGAPLLWLFLTTFLVTGFGSKSILERRWIVKWRSVWRLGIAWLNLFIMWGILGYFAVLRHRIIHTAGGLDNENQWSFGQILALATWVPIVFEFVYIFIWGIEESLGTHLPVGFRVSRHDKPDLVDFSVATQGVDPFGDEVPLMGLKPTFTSEASPYQNSIPFPPGFTPFSPGTPGSSRSEFPDLASPQSTTSYEPSYYDSGLQPALHARTQVQARSAWEQWNASGW